MEFFYFNSVVSYRVPVKEDGTLGHPEILKKWTTDPKAQKKVGPRKPKDLLSEEADEEEI